MSDIYERLFKGNSESKLTPLKNKPTIQLIPEEFRKSLYFFLPGDIELTEAEQARYAAITGIYTDNDGKPLYPHVNLMGLSFNTEQIRSMYKNKMLKPALLSLYDTPEKANEAYRIVDECLNNFVPEDSRKPFYESIVDEEDETVEPEDDW